MSVTVVITNYCRQDNLPLIIDALWRQTLRPTVFVGDNSSAQDFRDGRVAWMIRSSTNARCAPRWWMASHAVTDFIIIHDDDLAPRDEFVVADAVDAAGVRAPFLVGASGVVLREHEPYSDCLHVGLESRSIDSDTPVDIVKGRFTCGPTNVIAEMGHIDLDAEDDIIVSAVLGRGLVAPHVVPLSLSSRFSELPRGSFERERRPDHMLRREKTR